jgi:phage gp29-like protein
MPLARNVDRYFVAESWDIDPVKLDSILNSANSGSVKKQSRLANELTERDPAISQAWGVRVAAIAACPWEIVGGDESERSFISDTLVNIKPSYNDKLVSFGKLLQYLQSSALHGFAISQTEWSAGGSKIDGFRIYSQSLFSYVDSDLPYFQGRNGQQKITPTYPRWIYHTNTNSRDQEPLRTGIVRPLAYLYTMRRHIQIQYLGGLEKWGDPMPLVEVEGALYDDDNTEKQKIEQMLNAWTYDGYMLADMEQMRVTFPTANNGFDVNNFLSFLEWTEKQVFRLVLGQDSTSSADNSNRSTAAVHNLVRQDILASDARAVEETVNTQIIKPLYEATFGASNNIPKFRFNLKGIQEINEMAKAVETLDKAGYEVDEQTLSEKFGFKVTKKTEEVTNVNG